MFQEDNNFHLVKEHAKKPIILKVKDLFYMTSAFKIFSLPLIFIVFMLCNPAFSVTDEELKALEQQLLEQEAADKRKAEEAALKEREAEEKARARAKREAQKARERQAQEEEQRKAEQALQAELEKQKKELEQQRLLEEQRQAEEKARQQEEQRQQAEQARLAEEERIRKEVERRLAEDEKKQAEEEEKKRMAIEAINNLCNQIIGTWKWSDRDSTISRFFENGKAASSTSGEIDGTWECDEPERGLYTVSLWNEKRELTLEQSSQIIKSTGKNGQPVTGEKLSGDPKHKVLNEKYFRQDYLPPWLK